MQLDGRALFTSARTQNCHRVVKCQKTVGQAAGDLCAAYVKAGLLDVSIDDLPFERIAVPSNPTERLMNLRKHVFHNCLSHLPADVLGIVGDSWSGKGKG